MLSKIVLSPDEFFWKNILQSTTCIIWGNNILEEYMEFGESSLYIGFTVAADAPPRAWKAPGMLFRVNTLVFID